jgi:hypothetical protein
MHDRAKFRHFRYLLAILERDGFCVAADQLQTSQSGHATRACQFQGYASIGLYRKSKNSVSTVQRWVLHSLLSHGLSLNCVTR